MKLSLVTLGLFLITTQISVADEDYSSYTDRANELSVRATFKKICNAEFMYYMEASSAPKFLSAESLDGWKTLGIEDILQSKQRFSVVAEGEGERARFVAKAESGSTTFVTVGHISDFGTPICDPIVREN